MDTSRAKIKRKKSSFRKCHTPFCLDRCNITHHDLVVALCMDSRCVEARIRRLGELPIVVKQAIESTKLSGWDQDSDIPDPLDELKCPLLYLACKLGKARIVQGLLRSGFNPRAVNRHGETALHGGVRHLYNSAGSSAWKLAIAGSTSSSKKRRAEVFCSMLLQLTNYYPEILGVKDSSGVTPLHISATSIARKNGHYRYAKVKNRASFHQFCLTKMINRLFELEGSSFSKNEVIEIITTAENGNRDSILHILARDSERGFEVLKDIQDLLSGLGAELPEDKNRRNETVVSIAWQTDARSAARMFPGLPSAGNRQQQQQRYRETSTTTQSEMSRSIGEDYQEINIDIVTPQVFHSPHSENASSDIATGNPFAPEVSVTTLQPNVDRLEPRVLSRTPKITHTFSLASEEEYIDRHPELTSREDPETSSDVEIVESWAADSRSGWGQQRTYVASQSASRENAETNQLPWLHSDGAGNIESDTYFLEFVLTKGITLDACAKRSIVSIVLEQHKEKLRELETSLPQLEQMIEQSETTIAQKTDRLNALQKQVNSLKKEIAEKNKSRNDLRQKKELMSEEKNILKRRVVHCQETQNLLISPSKKARL